LHHAFQRAVVAIGPAMIGTAELLRAALRLCDHRGRMMTANVVEGAQLGVITARDYDGLVGNVSRKEAPFISHLIGTAHNLPGLREHALLFELVDALIEVPRRRNRPGMIQRIMRIVEIKQVSYVSLH